MPPTRAFLSLDGGRPAPAESPAPGGDAWIELIAWGLSAGQALDAASGLPTGKRQPPVLTATKPVDRVSRRLAAALEEGATIEECVLELWWPTPPPRRRRRITELQDRQTIRLKDVRVARIETVLPDPTDDWSLYDRPLETVFLVGETLSRTWGVASVVVSFDDDVRSAKGRAVELSGTVAVTDATGAPLPAVEVKGKLLSGKKGVEVAGETNVRGVFAWTAGLETPGGSCTMRVTEIKGFEGGPWKAVTEIKGFEGGPSEAPTELPVAETRLAVGKADFAGDGRMLVVTIVDEHGEPAADAVVDLILSRKGSLHYPKNLARTNARGKTKVALPFKWRGKTVSVRVARPPGS